MDDVIIKKLNDFFTRFDFKELNKGDVLIQAYENPRGIYYLEEGNIKMYFISKDGEEVILNIFKPFAFFPMSWAINSTPNIYYFEATTKVKVRVALKDEVLEFIKDNPDILFNLLSRVYKGTDGILERMTYLMSGDAYSRLIAELIIESKRFGEKKDDQVKLKISETDLASETGMTRETVSRQLKKLKDENLITFKNKALIINDIKKLENKLIH